MKLVGKKLEVLNIHRKGIFDMDAMAFCCDNCGRVIVNSATVRDKETGKVYVIGLDCKKTLIDKDIFARIEAENPDYVAKYKIKEVKREFSDMQKVMAALDNPVKYSVVVYNYGSGQDIAIIDKTKINHLGQQGESVFCESTGYLFKIGLRDVLLAAQYKGIIKLA